MAKNNSRDFLFYLGLFFIGLNFLAILLALTGIFYSAILVTYILAGILWLIYAVYRKKVSVTFKKDVIIVIVISLILIFILAYFTAPTIFSGRDQGSFSEAAIRLAQNHQLKFSTPASEEFFKIYPAPKCNKYDSFIKSLTDIKSEFWCGASGPGLALNFPGFNYAADGKLITHFSIGYIAYLAAFYSFLGLKGLIIANGITFFIFLLSFYLLAKQYLKTFSSLTSYFLLLTSFVFSWFFKFTLSENLALALIWFGILGLILFIDKKRPLYLYACFLSFFLLAFVRIEALAFIFMLLLVLFLKYRHQENFYPKLFNRKFLGVFLALITIFTWNLWININFFKASVKGFFHSFDGNIQASGNAISGLIYILKVLNTYALLGFLLLGLLGIIYFIKQKKYQHLIPLLIISPSLLYLFWPGISLDHPWMLRRFVFTAAPAAILYSVLFLDSFFQKKYLFYALSSVFLATNLVVFLPYLSFSENKNLLTQTEEIGSTFSSSDLILADRSATGDSWSMLTGPMSFLYGKQAVYFFNPQDLDKLDKSKFSHIYFIIPDNNLDFYAKSGLLSRIQPVKDYIIKTETLAIKTGSKNELLSQKVELPAKEKRIIYGKIYLLQ